MNPRSSWLARWAALALISVGLGLPSAAVRAQTPDGGTANPFDLGAGSRALALAGAYVAVADDVSALFWNPAGLARLDRAEVSAMHMQLFFDTPYDYLGAAYPLLDWGTFAVAGLRVAADGIHVRDERALPGGTGSLDQREYVLGFGRDLGWNVRGGLAVKIDQQRLLGDFATGTGLDAGLQYVWPERLLTRASGGDREARDELVLGLSAHNLLGSRLQLTETLDVLPLTWRAGAAYHWWPAGDRSQTWLLTAGVEKSTWRDVRWAAGLEVGLWELAALRGGFRSDGWTAGAGLQVAGIVLDYALSGEALGLSHRVTLSYRFGPSLSAQAAEREQRRQETLDREAEQRAREAVAEAKEEMAQATRDLERRHRREKAQWAAATDRRLARERNLQAEERKAAVANEYFKALHYFQGIQDFLDKKYQQAQLEFETVAKYDPEYLEVQLYLSRAKARAQGRFQIVRPENLSRYYQGIDFYVENKFTEAIRVWEEILRDEPNNALVLRNIEEARDRLARMGNQENGDRGGAAEAPPDEDEPDSSAPSREPMPQP